jgi:hypothetical protein
MVKVVLGAFVVSATIAGTVAAGTYTAGPLSTASGPSPFAAGCEGGGQSGTNYPNAEVEPWVAVDPTDPTHAIAVWQQDRWSNGGSHGLVSAVTHNSGTTWTQSSTLAPFSFCAGGTVANHGDFERASDPWVTFAPNGDAYQISLSFNDTNVDNAILASKSTDGGTTWSNPATLIRENTGSAGLFVDKESITADPYNSSRVYGVWDRSRFPSDKATPGAVHSFALRGSIQFSRTTNAGSTWTTKTIFDPKANQFSIGNQIVVLPNSTHDLVDITFLERSGGSSRSWDVDVLRSTDHGDTWSAPIKISDALVVDVVDPDTGQGVRTGDIIPDIAVDPSSGNLYAVWQDGRFSSPPKGHAHSGIAFSRSTDGGLTWSAPIQVNKVTTTQAFTPDVEVASDGTIGLTYYDFRNNTPAAGLPTDDWFVHCHPSTQNCLNPSNWVETHVGGPFDMETAPNANGLFVGDYEGLAPAGTKFLSVFGKANDGNTSNRTDIVSSLISP